jgi:hypothetical protein
MGTSIAAVRSNTSTDTHHIVLGKDGVVYCTCMAWRFSKERPKTCRHLKEYFAMPVKHNF